MNADYRETDIYGPGLDIEKYRSDVDKTLRKTFNHDLVGRFEKAVVQYQLVEEGDRIAVITPSALPCRSRRDQLSAPRG